MVGRVTYNHGGTAAKTPSLVIPTISAFSKGHIGVEFARRRRNAWLEAIHSRRDLKMDIASTQRLEDQARPVLPVAIISRGQKSDS